MILPTEPIGWLPRPTALVEAALGHEAGLVSRAQLEALHLLALRDTVQRLEAGGSSVIVSGEGGRLWAAGGARVEADLEAARRLTRLPVKQTLAWPAAGLQAPPVLPGPAEERLAGLVLQGQREIRACLAAGAYKVQLDLDGVRPGPADPAGALPAGLLEVLRGVLSGLRWEERRRIGLHLGSGGGDVEALLSWLPQLDVGTFYVPLTGARSSRQGRRALRELSRGERHIFVGVVDLCWPEVESPIEVRDRLVEAADLIPLTQLGTTDIACAPPGPGGEGDAARDIVFAKIRARIEGTFLAEQALGLA